MDKYDNTVHVQDALEQRFPLQRHLHMLLPPKYLYGSKISLYSGIYFVHSLDSTDIRLISLFSCKQGKLQFSVLCLAQKRQMIVIIPTSFPAHLKAFGLTMSQMLSENTNFLCAITA